MVKQLGRLLAISALLLCSSLAWATVITSNTSQTKNLSDTTAWVGGVAPRCTGLDSIVVASGAVITIDATAAQAGTLTLTQIAVGTWPTVTYSYSSYTGTIPVPGTALTFSGFSNAGNNVVAPLVTISGGASGTLTINYPANYSDFGIMPVSETHAGAAGGSYCALGTSTAPTTSVVTAVANPSGSSFSGTCSVAFSGGNSGTGAAATCLISGGAIITTLTYGGNYYTVAPVATYTCTGCSSTTSPSVTLSATGTAAAVMTGVLKVGPGISLISRGDLVNNLVNGSNGWLVLGAGSAVVFDSSLSASPTTTRYSALQTNAAAYRYLDATACTFSSPCVVSSVTNNGALPGAITDRGASSVAWGNGVKATCTAFSFVGDALVPFNEITSGNSNVPWSVTHSTFDNTGIAGISGNIDQNELFQHDYNVHTNSLGANSIRLSSQAAIGSVLREIVGNTFDQAPGIPNMNAVTFHDNYFANGFSGAQNSLQWASFDDTFMRFTNAQNGSLGASGPTASNVYFVLDQPTINPHTYSFNGSYNSTFTGFIIGVADIMRGDSGENHGCHATVGTPTFTINNEITLPTADGYSHSEMTSILLANTNWSLGHNTYWGGSYGSSGAASFGIIQSNESFNTPTGSLTSAMNNLTFSTLANSYFKFETQSSGGTLQVDVCSPSNCDYNFGYNFALTEPSCTQCTNQGNGYSGKWSVTPGAHDQTLNPNFLDYKRSAELWDVKYLGNVYSAWSSSGTYPYGSFVSDSNSTLYWGQTVNFRCINLTGCNGSNTASEPGRIDLFTTSAQAVTVTGSPINILVASSAGFHAGDTVAALNPGGGSSTQTVTAVPDGTHITLNGFQFAPGGVTFTISNITWRNYWEWASYYWLRVYTASGRTWTDSSIGVSGADAITTMMSWVRKGYAPTNPAFKGAASDGGDIGAVPVVLTGSQLFPLLVSW